MLAGGYVWPDSNVKTWMTQQLARLKPFTPEYKELQQLAPGYGVGAVLTMAFAYLGGAIVPSIAQQFAEPKSWSELFIKLPLMMVLNSLNSAVGQGIASSQQGTALQRHHIQQVLSGSTMLATVWGMGFMGALPALMGPYIFSSQKREELKALANSSAKVELSNVFAKPHDEQVTKDNRIIISRKPSTSPQEYVISFVGNDGSVIHRDLNRQSSDDVEKELVEKLGKKAFSEFEVTLIYDWTGVETLAKIFVDKQNGKMGTPRFTVEDAKGFAKALPSKAKEGVLTLARPAWQLSCDKAAKVWESMPTTKTLTLASAVGGLGICAYGFFAKSTETSVPLLGDGTEACLTTVWNGGLDNEATAVLMANILSSLSAFDSAGVLLPLLLLLVVGGSYMMNKMFEPQKPSAPAAPH